MFNHFLYFPDIFSLFGGSIEGHSKNRVPPISHAATLESDPRSYVLPTTPHFLTEDWELHMVPLEVLDVCRLPNRTSQFLIGEMIFIQPNSDNFCDNFLRG